MLTSLPDKSLSRQSHVGNDSHNGKTAAKSEYINFHHNNLEVPRRASKLTFDS